jgi:hypothetical protein
MFIDAIKTNTVVQTIFALNRVGEIAQRHRDEGRSSSLAAQTVSLAWDKAVANILTPELLKIIFTEHYVTRYAEGPTKVPRVYYAARQKYYTDADAKAMEPVFASLLKQTQKQPAAYYELTHDFRNNETFARLWAKERTALPAQYVMPHIAHLAKIYIDDKNNGTTVDSFARMSELMRADAQRDVRLQISTTGFQRTIILLARDVKVSPEKSQRLLQYVQAAMNTWTDENPGWSKHISKPFIEMLGKTLDAPQGSAASATLKTLLELRTYYTDLDEQMKLRREADRRALAKGWKPVIQRAAPQR